MLFAVPFSSQRAPAVLPDGCFAGRIKPWPAQEAVITYFGSSQAAPDLSGEVSPT